MKPLNVFIWPTDDRSGQASVIYHYAKMGHNVFLPKHGTLGLNWKITATWPMLMCKATECPTKRNLAIHGFEREESNLFGEDYFLTEVSFNDTNIYFDDITCKIIDVEKECPHIDVYHTLRGGENFLKHYAVQAAKYFPNAKWVSSTFNTWTITPDNREPSNAAKLIPANYEGAHSNKNNVNIMCHEFEAQLLGADAVWTSRSGFASFNHNFHVRQPEDFALFMKMNQLYIDMSGVSNLDVPNFGGNVRAQGADIRYAGDKGVTGQYGTLSPKEAISMMAGLWAIVHFKQTDWGGPVFYHALNTGTPLITTQRYVNASNSSKYLINDVNCCIINSAKEAAQALYKIRTNDLFRENLTRGMVAMRESIFDQNYWARWESFLENLV